MTDPVTEVVTAHLAAVNAQDLDAVMRGFDAEAVFTSPDESAIGARSIRRLFAEAFEGPVRATLVLRQAVTSGEQVACELLERLDLGEQLHEVPLAGFYTVRNGVIARVRIYRDAPA